MSATITAFRALSQTSGVVLEGGLETRGHKDHAGLSSAELRRTLRYRIQPSPGFTAPWYEFPGTVAGIRHQDSRIRDGFTLPGGFAAGIRSVCPLLARQ